MLLNVLILQLLHFIDTSRAGGRQDTGPKQTTSG